MKVIFKKDFIKQYGKLQKHQKKKVDATIDIFENNPFDIHLKNHPLSGDLEGRRSISVSFDLRIIFTEEGGYITVTMLQVGTHNQVY